MEEYSDIKTIEDLYNEEEISGKSYLFCVDNDIDTLQDLQKFIVENTSCENNIPDDLLLLCNMSQQDEINQVDSSNIANYDCTSRPIYEVVSVELHKQMYDLAIQGCSVRTKNCLDYIQSTHNYPSEDFFNYLFASSLPFQLKQIRNAGVKTIEEIQSIVRNIRANIVSGTQYNKTEVLNEDEEIKLAMLWTVITNIKQSLSVRCINMIDKIIAEHNNSLVQLYNYFSSSRFDIKSIKGIGKKSGEELVGFKKEIIFLIDDCLENNGANIISKIQRAKYETIVCLQESDIELIDHLSTTLGRTPLFKLIDCVINQDERTSIIALESTRIYNGVKVNIDSVCDTLGLTRERIRQLRNKFFADLIPKIELWTQHFDFSYYEQYCTASWDKNNIYLDEGVDFSDDFIDIVSSVLFREDYTLIGDMQECMMSFYDRKEALFIVPNDLADAFDFKVFLNDINQRVDGKIYEDYYLDLNHHILNYFKGIIKFDFVDSIMEYIRLMLFEKFQLIVDDGRVFFRKNSNKSLLEYIEEILEEKGDVMSLDEIYDVLESKYPGLTKSKTALRGSIIRSDRVDAISRSGKYALKEWNSKGIKTGTIRDIVYDYLLGYTTPQSLTNIESYVVQYRPGTDAKSIYSNLALDNKGLFTLLVLDDKRYVAISTHDYDSKFVNIKEGGSYTSKRTYQESFDVLYQFVLEYDRFPFLTSKDDEEVRISRFLSIARVRRKNNTLSEDELLILNRFESEFGDKEISKDQYNWNIRFSELENYILIYGKLPTVSSNTSLYTWVNKQKTSISQGKLREEDTVKIYNLLIQLL